MPGFGILTPDDVSKVEAMFAEADEDKSGSVDLDEFKKLIKKV